MTVTVIVFFHAVITVRNEPIFPQVEKYQTTIFRNPISRQLTEEKHISAPKPINHINPYHRRAKTMNKKQEQQILDYYSTTDKYIRNKTHSNAHQTVFTKESDKFQWLVLEQKSQCEVEVRQTDNHGTITARDNYELTGNLPKCVGVERLCEGANFQIPFNVDEINLIYQFGEQGKAETCASLSAILPQVKDSDTKQIVSDTLKKLSALSDETCAELTATTKRRKLTERDHSIKTRLAKAKEQAKQPTVAEGKQHRTHSKGKGDMVL
jgi:hypothetical protein